jgi:hypothetical protein
MRSGLSMFRIVEFQVWNSTVGAVGIDRTLVAVAIDRLIQEILEDTAVVDCRMGHLVLLYQLVFLVGG